MALMFVVFSSNIYARRKRIPMPDEGFWVIESNVKTPKKCTVYFYSNSQQLIGRQEFSGKKLNVSRKKVVKELNGLLFQALASSNFKQKDKNDSMFAKKE